MKTLTNKHMGWTIAVAAVVGAAVAFPNVSQDAAEHREDASWQMRAESLDSAQFSELSSDYAENLANLQLSQASDNSFAKDYTLTDNLLTYRSDDFDTVAHNVAEHQCLSEAIYYEARSESKAGQKAVAEVVLNRVDSKHFPNTICGVVYEGSERRTGCQFTFTCDGSLDFAPKGKSWVRSKDMARLVMAGGVKPLTNRATHYHTAEISPHWSSRLRMTNRIGSHVFYRFAPRDYVPSSPTLSVAPPS